MAVDCVGSERAARGAQSVAETGDPALAMVVESDQT